MIVWHFAIFAIAAMYNMLDVHGSRFFYFFYFFFSFFFFIILVCLFLVYHSVRMRNECYREMDREMYSGDGVCVCVSEL